METFVGDLLSAHPYLDLLSIEIRRSTVSQGQGLFVNLNHYDQPMDDSDSSICILELPLRELSINADTLMQAAPEFAELFYENFDELERVRIMLLLYIIKVYGNVLSPEQKWSWLPAYVQCLPQLEELDSVLLWTNDELLVLSGMPIRDAVEIKRNHLKFEAERVYDRYLAPLEEHMGWGNPLFESDMWIWCDIIYSSRVFTISSSDSDRKQHLVPLLDICKYSNAPNAWWEVSEDCESISLRISCEVPSGTELTISCGSKSSIEMLFAHGFLLEGNEVNDCNSFPFAIGCVDDGVDRKVMVEVSREGVLEYLKYGDLRLLLTGISIQDSMVDTSYDALTSNIEKSKSKVISQIVSGCKEQLANMKGNDIFPLSQPHAFISTKRWSAGLKYRRSMRDFLEWLVSAL
eukprot:Partr_v1_DN26538_c0_g1_i4_m3598